MFVVKTLIYIYENPIRFEKSDEISEIFCYSFFFICLKSLQLFIK